MGRREIPRDVVIESLAQGLVNALAALAEPVPEIARKITYFEASPTANAECQKRWKDLNDYVRLVKVALQDARSRTTIRPDAAALNAAPELTDKSAVVLYFETPADRDEVVELIQLAKPGMRPVNL
jgi:hypothetical protein